MAIDDIDKRFITDDFLLKYFPSPDRFNEITSNPPKSTLSVSEQRYIKFREEVNKEIKRSGHDALSDMQLATIIKHANGYLDL